METNNLSSLCVALLLVFLVPVGALPPFLKKKKLKPVPLTDDEIIALFPLKTSFTLSFFARDVLLKQKEIDCDIVSLAERLANLVKQGCLKIEKRYGYLAVEGRRVSENDEVVFLYSRIK